MEAEVETPLVSHKRYPLQIDCVWVASDRNGKLGAFITAGCAPIPTEAFDEEFMDVPDIEQRIGVMPTVSKCQLLTRHIPRPDDYIALAERGFYTFDWTDVHPRGPRLNAYELVALPERPAAIDALPHELVAMATALKLARVDFSSASRLDVRLHRACSEAD
jgi:hypothetical protein